MSGTYPLSRSVWKVGSDRDMNCLDIVQNSQKTVQKVPEKCSEVSGNFQDCLLNRNGSSSIL